MRSRLVKIFGQYNGQTPRFEIKDPSLARLHDGTYMMYATVFGPAVGPGCQIGRFHARDLRGPWTPLEPARLHGVQGPEICAPQILLAGEKDNPLWLMYVQTSCFSEDGVIIAAASADGIDFYADAVPAMTREKLAAPHQGQAVSVYDVSVSDITLQGIAHQCMVFSAYRKIGSGDIFMSVRKAGEKDWQPARMILRQEDVAFHNHPDSPHFEWGLEGAKIMQLGERSFILFGVCFRDKGPEDMGRRQRVFIAGSRSVEGPYTPLTMPLPPTRYKAGRGENGHPDILDLDDRLAVLYQERAGAGNPWHLRYTEFPKTALATLLDKRLPRP